MISSPKGNFRQTFMGERDGSLATSPESASRLDKWLWNVRIFKTRSLATAACRAGSVEIGGQVAKPSRDVRVGEMISAKIGLITRQLLVLGAPPRRVGAKLVANFCEDKTPPEELAKAKAHLVQQILAREKGLGRPTKRDRREHEKFFGED